MEAADINLTTLFYTALILMLKILLNLNGEA
jgi:hypothetical protein